jgi:hypothetical protein
MRVTRMLWDSSEGMASASFGFMRTLTFIYSIDHLRMACFTIAIFW